MELKSSFKLFKTLYYVDYPSYEVVECTLVGVNLSYHTNGYSAYGKPKIHESYYIKYRLKGQNINLVADISQLFKSRSGATRYAKRQSAYDQQSEKTDKKG